MKNFPIQSERAASRKARAAPASWRFAWLLAAPHRLGFFAGALMMSVSALWWAALLFSQAMGHAPQMALAPTLAHALLMALSFTPLFISGFLFTAGPKWLGLGEVSARSLQPAVVLMLLGWLLTIIGFHWHTLLASAGVGLVTAGWTRLCLKFIALLRQSRMARLSLTPQRNTHSFG